jgi:thymidylate synthase (FAD)
MQVRIIAKTTDALEVLFTACKTCTSEFSPSDIFDVLGDGFTVSEEDMEKLVKKVINSGHLSVLEHVNITFSIAGISRALSHQLVRHRHCSFSQQSQRYVTEKTMFSYVTPKSIIDNHLAEHCYNELMSNIYETYERFVEKENIPAEDARYILPNAIVTNLTMTLNLRELIHICNERLCSKAQWEFRELGNLMAQEVIKSYEWLKPYLKPKCVKNNKCTETKGCGRKDVEEMENQVFI